MRNDSILNTGQNSATINKAQRAKEAREQRKREKEAKRSVLTPAAEIVNKELEKELEHTLKQLLSVIGPSHKEDDVKSLIVSLNLYQDSMKRLKRRLSNIMRVKVKKGESFDEVE